MKLLIASDIHGDIDSMNEVMRAYELHGAEKILLLGDLLYHGPRNDLPKGYNPKAVIEVLNKNSDKILTVRGNCDTEVDQMVLSFPILADYAFLELDGLSLFATHGHHHNTATPPPLKKGDILLHGHTHVLKCEEFGNENFYINPGSISLPKENNPKTYIVYENRTFTCFDLNGNVIFKKTF
jgi:putative phosphoesterase